MTSLIHVPLPLASSRSDPRLPWVRWAMQGARFQLLSADPASGRFTVLLRFEPGVEAPRHRHVGSVEGIVLEGDFYYREHPEVRFSAGSYLFEPAGSVHQPVSEEGVLMLGIFHGPVEGLDEEGQVTGRIDCAWHLRTWNQALAALQPSVADCESPASAPA